MKEQDREQDQLPDFLKELRGDNPFITPHNYFRELPEQIMMRLDQEAKQAPRMSIMELLQVRLKTLLSPQPAWVLALIVIVAAVFFFDKEEPKAMANIGHDVTVDEIANYVESHIDEFDEFDFYVTEAADVDMLSETLEFEEIESVMDGLLDEMDLETIQRVL